MPEMPSTTMQPGIQPAWQRQPAQPMPNMPHGWSAQHRPAQASRDWRPMPMHASSTQRTLTQLVFYLLGAVLVWFAVDMLPDHPKGPLVNQHGSNLRRSFFIGQTFSSGA
jgi:hypothetical protein